jgi:hypothetical protein
MIIPENAKEMILTTLARRGIVADYVTDRLIGFRSHYESGLSLNTLILAGTRNTWFRTKPILMLAVTKTKEEGAIDLQDHIDLPTSSSDIMFGFSCASKLLAMTRAAADVLNGGRCLSQGWLGT